MMAPEPLEGTILPGKLQTALKALALLNIADIAVKHVDLWIEKGQMTVDR